MLRTTRPRRMALLVATAILLAPALAQAQNRRDCMEGRCSEPPPPHSDGGNGTAVAVGAGLLLGGAVLTTILSHKAEHPPTTWDTEETLDRDGPRFDEMVHLGEFEVESYLRNGWPLVFDVDTEPGASVVLEVEIEGVDPKKSPRYQLVPAPPEAGDTAAHGWYARADLPPLEALAETHRVKVRLTALKDRKFVPLTVYGVGAGPEAVGSVAVTVDYFGPSPVTRGGDHDASFLVSFHNQALFPQLAAQVTQQKTVQNGGFQRTIVDSFDLLSLRQPASAPSVKSAWPRRGGQFPGAGSYDLDVAAFISRGPWVIGFAPTPVEVK